MDHRDTRDTNHPRYDHMWLAEVTDRDDPRKLGRVRVRISGILEPESRWAFPIGLMLGVKSGLWVVPEVGAQVVVWFNQGLHRHPYYIPGPFGAPKGEFDSPSQDLNHANFRWKELDLLLDATPDKEKIQVTSKTGHRVEINDDPTSPQILVVTNDGHQILIDDLNNKMTLSLEDGPSVELDKDNLSAIIQTKTQRVSLLDQDLKISIESDIGDIEEAATNLKQTFSGAVNLTATLASIMAFTAGVTISAAAGAAVLTGLTASVVATAGGSVFLGVAGIGLRLVNELFLVLYNQNVAIHNANVAAHNANIAVIASHVHPATGPLGPVTVSPTTTPPTVVMNPVSSADTNTMQTQATLAN